MRFRRRLQMNIIPILLFAVLLVTATVVYTSSIGIRSMQEDIMKYRLEVVYEYASSEYETLERVNLQNTNRYIEEAKVRIYNFVKGTELPGGLFLIVNSENQVVFHSASSEFKLPDGTSDFLKNNALARSTGFEPAISSVTGRRDNPFTTSAHVSGSSV